MSDLQARAQEGHDPTRRPRRRRLRWNRIPLERMPISLNLFTASKHFISGTDHKSPQYTGLRTGQSCQACALIHPLLFSLVQRSMQISQRRQPPSLTGDAPWLRELASLSRVDCGACRSSTLWDHFASDCPSTSVYIRPGVVPPAVQYKGERMGMQMASRQSTEVIAVPD